MSVIRIRSLMYEEYTAGLLTVDDKGFVCFTVELPWVGNQQNVSCIPPGEYKYKLRHSPSLGYKVIWLYDVTGRSWIYIHIGNYTRQIKGCILVGKALKDVNGDKVVDTVSSEAAFEDLMDAISPEGTIIIERY